MSGRNFSKKDTRDREKPYRLFLAVDIPAEAVHKLVGWQQRYLAAERALRLTPAGQLHITLVFLGQMGERGLELAADQLEKLEDRRAFPLSSASLTGLPGGKSPRVVAACFEEPLDRLHEIHDELAAGLVAKRLYKKEKRPYFPHVTIARARSRVRMDFASIQPEPIQFTAVRVTLYNSILKPTGAVHKALKTVQLI